MGNIRFYISSKDAFLFSLDNPVFQIYIILYYHYSTISTYCRSAMRRILHIPSLKL